MHDQMPGDNAEKPEIMTLIDSQEKHSAIPRSALS
jgi:hypothetical protein